MWNSVFFFKWDNLLIYDMGIYGIIHRDHESYPNWVMGEISTIPNRMNKLGLQHKTPFSTRFLKTLWGYWNWNRAQERCLLRLNIEFNWIYHRSSRNIQERYGRLDHNGPHVRQNYYQRWIHWLNQSEPRWWSQTPCETSILKWSLGWGSTRPHSGKNVPSATVKWLLKMLEYQWAHQLMGHF